MPRRRSVLFALVVLAACLPLAGCGSIQQAQQAAQTQQTMNQLKMLGLAYISHIDANMRGPANWTELKQAGGNAPELAALETAGCVVVWDKHFRDAATTGASGFIVAYLPDVPQSGGHAVMLDGSVRQFTAEEFKATLDAQNAAAATPAP
jgi:hypothetical protein